eukprot:7362677-Pyramimonas_sp.AAC.1
MRARFGKVFCRDVSLQLVKGSEGELADVTWAKQLRRIVHLEVVYRAVFLASPRTISSSKMIDRCLSAREGRSAVRAL